LTLLTGGAGDDDDAWKAAAVAWTARRVHRRFEPAAEEHEDWLAEPAEEGCCRQPLNRLLVIWGLLRHAARRYEVDTGEQVKLYQRRVLGQFARNYAILEGGILPDLYQLIAAARGAVDDNFAYAVLELARHYPHQQEAAELPTIRVRGEEIWLGTRKIRLRRRLPRLRRRAIRLRERPRERFPGEWLTSADGSYLCSYPPEDLVIEDYALYIRKKGVHLLTEERARVQPFTTSLLDGIDMRETIRHWHEKQIYVREKGRIQGAVGSVVIIFDPDLEDTRYPFRMTWLGEHHQESDLAFYATPMTEQLVGPGIFRCEYGGLVMSYPPMRMAEIWLDPFYRAARSKPEVLLMAGIDYCEDRIIAYIAARPPASYLKRYAEQQGKRVLYIPIGQLSPVSLRRIRVFHVLAGRDKREIAGDYIFT